MVVNADDLGLHADINRGILLAHTDGVVTSTSAVTCGEAFADASRIMRDCPQLDVGVHLTLIEERPLSPANEIPTLVGSDGRFLSSYRQLTARILAGAVSSAEVRVELQRQIERLLEAGRRPTHLDGHQHAHLLPAVWRVAVELAREHGIRWIRTPRFTSLFAARKSPVEPMFRLGLNVLSARAARAATRTAARIDTAALHLSGRLAEADLVSVITGLRPGISEIVTHPGVSTPELRSRYRWNYEWSTELAALTSSRTRLLLRSNGVKLTRFSEL